MITEAFIPESKEVRDDVGRAYLAQFMITLQHPKSLYEAFTPVKYENPKHIQSVIAPGLDWLYFEIYCHSGKVNEILKIVFLPFLKKFKNAFKCWFFIRYTEPSSHIRLRFKLKDKTKSNLYTSNLVKLLESYLISGVVTDIQIKTYKREVQRYGYAQIENIEAHFGLDSGYALEIINNGLSVNDRYYNCIILIKNIIQELQLDLVSSINFIKGIQDSYIAEHGLDGSKLKKVNKAYEIFRNEKNSEINPSHAELSELLIDSFRQQIRRHKSSLRPILFIDLFHMHINRLFSTNQRTHEMIIYCFTYKMLQAEYKNFQTQYSLTLNSRLK